MQVRKKFAASIAVLASADCFFSHPQRGSSHRARRRSPRSPASTVFQSWRSGRAATGDDALKMRPLVTASGKSLYAVVAQVSARKPVLAKKLAALDPTSRTEPACGTPEGQREPLRATFHPAGKDAISFDIVPGSVVLVEDSEDEPEAAVPWPKQLS